MRWAGFAVLLYLACVAAFVVSNVATVLAIGGDAVTAPAALQTAVMRGALVCVPIALIGVFLVPALSRHPRR